MLQVGQKQDLRGSWTMEAADERKNEAEKSTFMFIRYGITPVQRLHREAISEHGDIPRDREQQRALYWIGGDAMYLRSVEFPPSRAKKLHVMIGCISMRQGGSHDDPHTSIIEISRQKHKVFNSKRQSIL